MIVGLRRKFRNIHAFICIILSPTVRLLQSVGNITSTFKISNYFIAPKVNLTTSEVVLITYRIRNTRTTSVPYMNTESCPEGVRRHASEGRAAADFPSVVTHISLRTGEGERRGRGTSRTWHAGGRAEEGVAEEGLGGRDDLL